MGQQAAGVGDWEHDLEHFLAPFVAALGDRRRGRWAPVYVRGLLGPGDRKSVQPMAARVAPGDYAQLHHFVAGSPWDPAPLEGALARAAQRLVGGPDAVLIVDDTALLKQGRASVGVTRQYAGVPAAVANCQVLVSLTLARGEVPVPLALRLFLPAPWRADPARCRRAGVPPTCLTPGAPRTKPALALAELDRAAAAGVTFGLLLADAAYGQVPEFRHGLTARGLTWAVGVPRTQLVYPADVALATPPRRGSRGRARTRPVPSCPAGSAAALLAGARWRAVAWREGSRGRLRARFAAAPVRVADGPYQAGHRRRLPGEPAWLVGEERADGERRYYLTNLPPGTPLRDLARAVKARWSCEQAHQQLKEELGLDHYEGRTWPGLHHHALLTMISFAFLQHLRLREAAAGEKNPPPAPRSAPTAHAPGGAARRPRAPNDPPPRHALPALPPPVRVPPAPLGTSG